ncbi:MAG: hypothetical protein K6G74_00995 [Bacilli bacterium]|nr:hypothetical protein [Bacilli bacterium]
MKKQLLTLIITAGLLASCGTNPTESSKEASSAPATSESVTWVSPTGSPTLAFYDQGNNDKWLSTATPDTVMPSAFASASYDAIVFDGVSGLTMIKNMNRAYKLAKWINEGSFYVVSTKHTAEEAVTVGSKPSVNAFVSTGNASKAFRDLAKNKWNWGEYGDGTETDAAITYEKGVADVRTHLLGSDPDAFDYYVVAEPVLTAVQAQYKQQNKTLNVIYNIQTEFAAAHNGAKVPAAAIFVSNAAYETKKAEIDTWLSETQTRIDNVKSNASVAVNAVKAYEDNGGDSQTRFGVPSNMINLQQVVGQNKLAYLAASDVTDKAAVANGFNSAIGSPLTFDASCFLA